MRDIKWAKDEEILDLENKKYVGGSLADDFFIIKSPTEKDGGTYSCTVTNAVGSVSNIVTIGNNYLVICTFTPSFYNHQASLYFIIFFITIPLKYICSLEFCLL